MSAPTRSLVALLTRSLTLWMTGIWVVASLGVTWYVRQEVSENFDAAMTESGYSLLELATQEIEKTASTAQDPPAAASLARTTPITPLTRMALTLAHTHDHASGRVGEPGRAAPSTKDRVWAVVFAFAARCVRADGQPGIERSM